MLDLLIILVVYFSKIDIFLPYVAGIAFAIPASSATKVEINDSQQQKG